MLPRRARSAFAALAVGAFSVTAVAQDGETTGDGYGYGYELASGPETTNDTGDTGWYPEGSGDSYEDTPLFAVEVAASGQVVSFENADFMPLDESDVETIQDTDDRTTFGRTWLTLSGSANPVEPVEIDLTLEVGASWGAVGSDSEMGLGAASANVFLFDGDAFRLSTRAGRQRFEIGGAPDDYYLKGTVDGFTVEAEVVDVLTLRVLAFDLFFPQEYPEAGHSVFYSRPQGENPAGQRGETNTYRTGAVLQSVDQLVDGLDLRAFFFHATIAGSQREYGTGSDISEGGLLGNFRDRDYVRLMGARVGYGNEALDGALTYDSFVEFARSSGIDRKESTSVDVDLAGNALGVGLEFDYDFGVGHVGVAGDWHRMDGAQYSVNGLEFQRGFVSMYGDTIGGLASSSIARMRPSAYLSRYGVEHLADTIDRSAGTDFTHVALQLGIVDTELELGFWTYADTRESSFDQSTLAEVEPPPEHSREEFAAQVRTGQALGYEIDVRLEQAIRDYAALFFRAGLFLPGDYYELEVSRAASPRPIEGDGRLGGTATFWAVAAGAEFGFGYRRAR